MLSTYINIYWQHLQQRLTASDIGKKKTKKKGAWESTYGRKVWEERDGIERAVLQAQQAAISGVHVNQQTANSSPHYPDVVASNPHPPLPTSPPPNDSPLLKGALIKQGMSEEGGKQMAKGKPTM